MNPTAIYNDYKPALTRVCARLVRDPRDAEELVHDSLLKAFTKMDTFDPAQSTLYTWMRRIALNTTISFLRRRGRPWNELPENLEYKVSGGLFRESVVLNLLPPATQKVLRLYVIEGYSLKEIGQIVGISEGTSRWHMAEARRILRTHLKNQI